jgi:MarC family membrane protein
MANETLSTVILLAFVIDPFGNVPVVNAMLAGFPPPRRRAIVLRECAIAVVILLAFMLGGKQVLDVMHLTPSALAIAGGVILFMIAIRMVFGDPEGVFGMPARGGGGDPLIVPLAVPLIAGPSALATVMLMASRQPEHLGSLAAALTVTMVFATVVLVLGDRLQQRLGERAMQAIERLMGLVLTAMAVEMLLGGIRMFVEGLK